MLGHNPGAGTEGHERIQQRQHFAHVEAVANKPVRGKKVATAGIVPTDVVTVGAGWQYDETTGSFFAYNAEAYVAGF
jgi:hypothetical protein